MLAIHGYPIFHGGWVASIGVKESEFELLLFVDVEERASAEPDQQPGKPKYSGRPWTRLRDEMVATGVRTITELPAGQIRLFYASTKSTDDNAKSIFRRLFGGH